MSIDSITLWHKRARPNPSEDDFNKQLGCHFEEIAEMLETLSSPSMPACDDIELALKAISTLANNLKYGGYQVDFSDREGMLDSLCDQIVTALGVGHCANMKTAEAIKLVDESNWTKYDENGLPVFNDHGKIQKGPHYAPPVLDGLY